MAHLAMIIDPPDEILAAVFCYNDELEARGGGLDHDD